MALVPQAPTETHLSALPRRAQELVPNLSWCLEEEPHRRSPVEGVGSSVYPQPQCHQGLPSEPASSQNPPRSCCQGWFCRPGAPSLREGQLSSFGTHSRDLQVPTTTAAKG